MRKFYNENLQHQYEHDSHFRSRVDSSEKKYSDLLKCAAKEPPGDGVNDNMLERFIGDDNHCTYFFYGHLQPSPNRGEKELLFYLVRNFQPEPGVPFTFVYFNHHTPSSDYYFRFKYVFDLLPLRLIEKMRAFYLVKPYFYIKAFDMLGQSNRIFAEVYRTIDNCEELVKRQNYKLYDFVTFVPQEISEEFPKQIKRRPSLLTYRINVEGQNLTQEELKEKRDFENSVKALITKQIYKLENYELGQLGVPMVLQLLVGYFKDKPSALLHQGIFRKSVSIDEENETLTELSSRNFSYLQQINNPHLIASLIKKFFSNLKQPIIPFSLFERLMHDQGVANKREFVKQLIAALPSLNFLSLMFVIDFLRKDVIPVEKDTLMSAHNLAICFSPAFMRSEKPSFADIVNASKAVIVTQIMINDFDEIFGHQQQRNKLFQKSMMARRVNLKRNLKEEIGFNLDDRTSEEHGSTIFIVEDQKQETQPLYQQEPNLHQGSSIPAQVQQIKQELSETNKPQPQWGNLAIKKPIKLSKEVYKSDIHKDHSQPFHIKSSQITVKEEQAEPPKVLHQVKSESYVLQHNDQEQERPKSKKTRQQLVQQFIKNKQQTAEKHQASSIISDSAKQKSSVTRSTIDLNSAVDQN